ncbi:MAG: phosphoribosylformylglycinamidine synthase subunit PurS [bacterium]
MLAKIFIKPKKGILDPQGKAVSGALGRLGFKNIKDVRVGKYIEIVLDDKDIASARINVQKMCETLLVNRIIEDYTFDVTEE